MNKIENQGNLKNSSIGTNSSSKQEFGNSIKYFPSESRSSLKHISFNSKERYFKI